MANEIAINYAGDYTLYALLLNTAGQVWNGAAFEAPQDANWSDYDIALAEVQNTELYLGNMPAVAAGVYYFAVRRQIAGAPAVTDPLVGTGVLQWDGSAEVVQATIDSNVDAILVDTGIDIPATLATLATAADLAVVDGNVDLTLADLGGMDLKLDDLLLYVGTDGVVVAAASKAGYALSAAGVDAILDEVVEGTYTFRQMMRLFMAALAGLSDGGGTTTITFRDVADSLDRIEATVDADGNRTALTLDAT